jgi:hypothetical protein
VTSPNVIKVRIDKCASEVGFIRQSGAWYLRQAETIAVIDLQKSDFGQRYYINIALWLLPLGDTRYPKEWTCHIRTRADALFPEREETLKLALDLDSPMTDAERVSELVNVLNMLLPMFRSCATIDGLGSSEGLRLVKASLVMGPAQELLRHRNSEDSR